jgi:hypothetical protein
VSREIPLSCRLLDQLFEQSCQLKILLAKFPSRLAGLNSTSLVRLMREELTRIIVTNNVEKIIQPAIIEITESYMSFSRIQPNVPKGQGQLQKN